MTSIVFTGGGTAGHVAPNLALIPEFQKKGWKIAYIGTADGIEKGMLTDISIPFYSIQSGKLRRYLSIKNLTDPLKIVWGMIQAFYLLRKIKPDVVFSKGGFVAFPVVVGAWFNRIPVVAHESDLSPGLANRLSIPFINTICLTFESGKKYFKRQKKIVHTGTPIREQLFQGQSQQGLQRCGFLDNKPCLLILGGSMGASSINKVIRAALPQITPLFHVIHICGRGKIDSALEGIEGYKQFEYVNKGIEDLYAAASFVISRSGANSLYEILALQKPHILIPLSAKISRGDQVQNAAYFKQMGVSLVIDDDILETDILLKQLNILLKDHVLIASKLKQLNIHSGTQKITAVIEEQINAKS